MPPGTVIAHKTGTIGGTANDAGVLTLPDDRGQIIISAYIKKSPAPMESRDFVIADVARAIRDFYMFAG
jgi:beta-lactamase class A